MVETPARKGQVGPCSGSRASSIASASLTTPDNADLADGVSGRRRAIARPATLALSLMKWDKGSQSVNTFSPRHASSGTSAPWCVSSAPTDRSTES